MSGAHAERDFATFVEVLRFRAAHQASAIAFTFLGDTQSTPITYAMLDTRARCVAAVLQAIAPPGARAILLYPPGLEFIVGLFGCLYAGVIPAPAYPPLPRRRLPRVQAIAADARPAIVLTAASELAELEHVAGDAGLADATWIASDAVGADAHAAWVERPISGETLALLQYTSGSTSTPKGIMVSHANLLHNSGAIRRAFQLTRHDVSLSWLPSFHDMGLIDGVLQPIYTGFPAFLMAPSTFLQQPNRWLQEISDRKVTHSGGPDFAYALCARKTSREQRARLDLSSWSGAYNGAEPIRAATMREFVATFAPCGFRPHALFPCYGLAESTLMVSGGPIGQEPVYLDLRVAELERDGLVVPATSGDAARTLVGCGRVQHGTRVVIADPTSRRALPPGQVGEIWIAGPSVAGGYWDRAAATQDSFRALLADTGDGPFLRSGDLGFLWRDELFVTGRLKDLVIVRGRNHYPQDLEMTAERSHPALRLGCSAAFTVPDPELDRLVIVCEVERTHLRSLPVDEIAGLIRQAIGEEHEIQVHTVVLLRTGLIPKTSSGKIQRRACAQAFLDGTLPEVGRSVLDADVAADAPVTRDAILAADDAQRWPLIRAYVAQVISQALRVARTDIAPPDARPDAPPDARPDARNESLLKLGMDSLTAVELQHRVTSDLGVAVGATDFFHATGALHVAERVAALLAQPEEPRATAPAATTGDHPMSRGQQALWFLHQADPESAAHNVGFAVRVRAELRADRVRRAFAILVERHEALRTVFPTVDGRPAQRVLPAQPIEVVEVDAAGWSEPELADRLSDWVHRPFELGRGPLLRVWLCHRAAEDHVLVLAAHHIVVDFWSLRILLEELLAAYRALSRGAPIHLPPLAAQPADHARWEAAALAGRRGDALWMYWQHLAGARSLTTFPADRTRPPVLGSRGAALRQTLDPHLVVALKQVAATHEASPYMLMLAALQLLVHRYTGLDDVVIGSVASGRDRPELGRAVGYFANQIVLRAQLDGDRRFDELLAQARDRVLGALAHQDYPFSVLVERLQPVRDHSHAPVVQTVLVMEKSPPLRELERDGGLPLEVVPIELRAAQVDLTVRIVDDGATWHPTWEYSTELFVPATIARFARHFETLLRAIAAQPAARLSGLDLLTPQDKASLLVDWNRTETAYARGACVHHGFEAQVDRDGDAIAVSYLDERLSYRELERRANQLAHHLRGLGVGVEDRVGVCLARSPDLVVALLGVLKAGAAYVPLDPSYPPLRLTRMIEDARLAVLVTGGDAPPGARQRLDLVTDRAAIDARPDARPAIAMSSENLAYVIYTSGSTGVANGAMVTHRNLVNYLSWCCAAYAVADGRGAPVSTSIAFDATVTSLFAPLVTGRTAVLLPEQTELPALVDALSTVRDFSLIKVTPAHLELMRAALPPGAPPAGARVMVVGGEALPAATVAFWRGQAPAARIVNEYGPTEATVGCCVHTATGDESGSGSVPIGRPIANTKLYVLDGHGQPAPIGAAGEIYIAGDGLARGYLDRPALTAERFRPDPFSGLAGARMYKTGDLARHLADGTLEFLGRIDDQVKLRGFRVELDEVRAALLEHPAVEDAVAVVRDDGPSKWLVAYVVARRGHPPASAADHRRFVAERLPHYMVPSAVVAVPAIPLTPNGKVDRRALPAPETMRPARAGAAPPSTAMERIISAAWCEVLRVDAVATDDNFFDLGGHSMLAIEVKARLERVLGRDIPLVQLLQRPTVAALARSLEQPTEVAVDVDTIHSHADRRRSALRSGGLRSRKKP